MIYLDYSATSPMIPEAIDAYARAAKKYYGNSSSLHNVGTEANEIYEACRSAMAKLLNGKQSGVFFTSGGTESNQLAIRSLLKGDQSGKRHLLTTKMEHASLKQLWPELIKMGYTISYVPADAFGMVTLKSIKEHVTENTALVTIQHVNHEIGVIQPISEIGSFLQKKAILFHSDCVQSFGKLKVDVENLQVDSLSVSSHKVGGPKGAGLVYIRPEAHWSGVLEGVTHQEGFRPGTVDVPAIFSFVVASEKAYENLKSNLEHSMELRKHWLKTVRSEKITTLEHPFSQLPSILGLMVEGVQGQYAMLECNRRNIAVSTGSACHVGQQDPSPTLLAMGKSKDEANQLIRVSFGPTTDLDELNALRDILEQI